MQFTLMSGAPLLVACVDVLLGVVILLQDPRSLTNAAYALFAFTVGLWGFGVGFFFSVSDPAWIDFLARFLYFAGGSIPVTFLLFAYIFNAKKPPSKALVALIVAPTLVFIYLYFFTDLMIAGYQVTYDGIRGYRYGDLHYLFDLQLWGYFVWAFVILVKKYNSVQQPTRNQVALIIFGTYSVLAIAGITNVIAPLISVFELVWVGPTTTIIWTWVVAYAIIRHQFFNVRIIAGEMLIISLWLLLLSRIIFSSTLEDIWINTLFFIATVILGTFVIRSIIKEVRQREEIERLSEGKSEFMSFASHEIRNPITAMRGYASLIVDGTAGEVSAQAKDSAEKILINGDTVLSLISQFLNKSKLELGQISYAITDFDAEETVSSVTDGFKPHAQQKGLTLEKHIDFPRLMAHGDEAKLREVVGNLIDNSIKYTKTGSITVSIEKRNGMVRVVIQDTGVGIPHETLPHLFQKFSRADAHKMNLLGTGLGLYLAKTFVEGMGGKIWAESDGQDKGSRFIIELPAV